MRDINRIPMSALERMVYVTDETARFNLTINSAQNGDVVKQQDTGVLYFIVDDTNLNNSSGYEAFTAGTAGAVEWTNILNKPSDIFYTTTMNADSISTTTSTNKFTTQSDINKLSSIESGAEVNNISDTNATALTNNGDTSIHYHSADRIRANHTGTQPASTISDFNTAVAGTPSVTANTAKVSFPEAPNDGSYYARKSLGWSPVLYTENTIFLENPTAPNVASGDNSTKVANTAFVTSQALGVVQIWQNMTSQRVVGQTYTNTTGKPISVKITIFENTVASNVYGELRVGETLVDKAWAYASSGAPRVTLSAIVPSGSTYIVTGLGAGDIIENWAELR